MLYNLFGRAEAPDPSQQQTRSSSHKASNVNCNTGSSPAMASCQAAIDVNNDCKGSKDSITASDEGKAVTSDPVAGLGCSADEGALLDVVYGLSPCLQRCRFVRMYVGFNLGGITSAEVAAGHLRCQVQCEGSC
jgi:hypothetical protein